MAEQHTETLEMKVVEVAKKKKKPSLVTKFLVGYSIGVISEIGVNLFGFSGYESTAFLMTGLGAVTVPEIINKPGIFYEKTKNATASCLGYGLGVMTLRYLKNL